MPTPDANLYGHATSDYRLRFSLETARQFAVMDVDEFGDDTNNPPAADAPSSITVAEFDNVTGLGPLAGSVDGGGWSCPFAIAKLPATFPHAFGVRIAGTAYYSNSPLAPVTLLRGYIQDIHPARTAGSDLTQFVAQTSDRFLKDHQLSYGIDWWLSADHIAPIAVADAVRHMLTAHTNLLARSALVIGLPDVDLDQVSTSAGDLHGIVTGLIGCTTPEAWLFQRRDDTTVATTHPNLAGAAYPYPTPVIDFSDDMVFAIDAGPQLRENLVASVNLVAQTSDQDQLTSLYPLDGAPDADGGRVTVTGLRSDDQDWLDGFAALVYAHLNRRWRQVTVTMGINFAFDIGDLVTVTTTIPQRGIAWSAKRFVVKNINYAINQDQRTLLTSCVLDEVV